MVDKKISNRIAQMNWFPLRSMGQGGVLTVLMVLGALMAGSLLLRNPNMGADALMYHSAVHNLFAGNGWTYFIYGYYSWAPVEPGYGLLSYFFYLLTRDIEYSGMLVSAFAYLLLIPTTFFTTKFLFGKWSAVLASVLVTFWPTVLSFSYVNLSDTAFTFFLLLGFSLYIRVLLGKNTLLKNALLGLVLGFTYLIREPEGLLIASLAIGSLFFFEALNLSKSERKLTSFNPKLKTFVPPATALLGFLLVALSYVVFIHSQSGVWSLSIKISPISGVFENADSQTAAETIITPATPGDSSVSVAPSVIAAPEDSDTNSTPNAFPLEGNPLDAADTCTPAAVALTEPPNTKDSGEKQYFAGILAYSPRFNNLAKNMSVFVRSMVGINFHALVPLILLIIIYPILAPVTLCAGPRLNSRKVRILTAFAIFFSPAVPHLLVSALASRYLMQYSVYVLIAAAYVSTRLLEKIMAFTASNQFKGWLIVVCLLSVVVSLDISTPSLRESLTARHGHLGLRAAGFWLRDNVDDADDLSIIAPRKGAVALFYASDKNFPKGRIQDIDSAMTIGEIGALVNKNDIEHLDIDYLLLDNLYAHTLPQLEPLWDNPALAQEVGLTLLHRDSNNLFQIYAGNND